MKTIHQKMIIPAGISLLTILPALAIEPPKDDAPPPPSVKSSDSTPAGKDTAYLPDDTQVSSPPRPRIVPAPESSTVPEKSSIAYIGIISDDIPEMLAAHIGVRQGEGVMIRDLAPGGPAEDAGFARYDIITHVGGKTIGSPADLSQKISACKPGDEITIDLIHQGTKSTKIVKLETRPEGSGRTLDPRQLGHLDLDNLPDDQADRVREMIERQLKDMMRQSERPQGFNSRRGNHERLRQTDPIPEPQRNGFRGFQFKSDATFRLMDNDGSIEMKSSDGKRDITVRDLQGKEVWSGPWDTEQDKSAAPQEVRERIEKFKFDDSFRGGGFRFRMGGGEQEDLGGTR